MGNDQGRTVQLFIENQSKHFGLRLNPLDFDRVRYLDDIGGMFVGPGEALQHRVECDAGNDHLPHEATFRVLMSAEPHEEGADPRGIFPLCVLRGRFAYDGEDWTEGRILAETVAGAPEGVLRLVTAREPMNLPGARRFSCRLVDGTGGADARLRVREGQGRH